MRDSDTAAGSDVDYYLDTPPGVTLLQRYAQWDDGVASASALRACFHTWTTTAAATLIESPLWYAAKWGGFVDQNDNNMPNLQSEWDADGDGVPDTYFYVVNPLKLEQQLTRTFSDILSRGRVPRGACRVRGRSQPDPERRQALHGLLQAHVGQLLAGQPEEVRP
ncbi:MAG: hypothetical protein MZU95_06510 [Desulfomicrobium escambiense]|nr:hypothetical protein [Desulfomicrobium escambiense]